MRLLFNLVIEQIGLQPFQVWVLRSQGYGARIYQWDELLDKQQQILVDKELFEELSAGIEEWFYDLDARAVSDDLEIKFGLHDSTSLYIDAPPEFAKLIIQSFKFVQEAQVISSSQTSS